MKRKKRPRTAITREGFRSRVYPAVLSCLALLILCIPSEARKPPKPIPTAVIFGTVWGPDDRPVAGVLVKVRKANDKKARWEVQSNRRGEFEQEVPSGKQDYVIWADAKSLKLRDGRRLRPGPEVTVHVESNERADTGLHLE